MRIRYEIDGDKRAEYNSMQYKEKKFILKGYEGEELEYNPVLRLDSTFDQTRFKVVLLNSKNSAENNIYIVQVKNSNNWERIGWIFPVQALLSKEHSQAENIHFLRYAYVATYILLEKAEVVKESDDPEELFLDQLYDSEKIILVIDNDNTDTIDGFDIENYVIGLYKYGYTWEGEITPFVDIPESIENNPGKIKLECISHDLRSVPIINVLFKDQLSRNINGVLRFYWCYQIIELLIQEIFKNDFQKQLSSVEDNIDSLFEIKEKINDLTGEKFRIRELFNQYTNGRGLSSGKELAEACGYFLSHLNRKTDDDAPSMLYSVRCILVHNMYVLGTENTPIMEHMIEDINVEFTKVLMNILFSFHCT